MAEGPGLFGDAPASEQGHRSRLKARFLKGGADAMPDYELLELVLFAAIPRRDVKPLAKALIARFGGFAEVCAAPAARLKEAPGVGEAVVLQLKLAEAAGQRLARGQALGREVLTSWSAVRDYCRAKMARLEVEEFRVLYLDRKNALIADEALGRGTVDGVPVYPREVAKRALELGASAVILAHNHPSGDPTPSEADVAMTRKVKQALAPLQIALHDHLVIGRDSEASLAGAGLI